VNIVSLVAIYFVVWWIVLFAVLPWGVRSQHDEGEATLGTERSAPVKPMLVRKAVATSIVAAILVGALWVAVDVCGFELSMLAGLFDARP